MPRSSRRNVLLALAFALAFAVALAACSASNPLTAGGGSANIDDTPGTFLWKAVGAGSYNFCALSQGGQRYCWGAAVTNSCLPTACPRLLRPTVLTGALTTFDTLASGGGIHCGRAPTGDAYCWGDASYSIAGSIGDGTTARSEAPVRMTVTGPIRALAIGYAHGCALDAQGDLSCWGYNSGGVVGRGTPTELLAAPGKVATTVKFKSVTAGTTQSCAIATDDTGYCWGSGYGALGIGARDTVCSLSNSCTTSVQPLAIEGGLRWAMLSAGNTFTCGVTLDHRGYCWGAVPNFNDPNPPYGVLGNGTFIGTTSPSSLSGTLQFQSIATGTRHACGITLTGEAYCWGNNTGAELGIGTSGSRYATPQPVVGGLHFLSLALADQSCGITVNHNLYCWGSSLGGQLGNGASAPSVQLRPTRVLSPGS